MKLDAEMKRSMMDHIKSHAKYPASKADLVAACNNMSEFSKEHKSWFEKALPAASYRTPNDVIKALRL